MKSPIISLILLVSACQPTLFAVESAPRFPPHIISDSELRVLPAAPNGRVYQLHIRIPASYGQQPGKRYPVLYVTDGYWDFPTIVTSYDNLVYDKVVPEFIIVGLGYAGAHLDYGKLRGWELSPVPTNGDRQATGHAAEFLGYLEKDIIPFIEREYRVDSSYRVLAGSSLGGLFTLYTMYSRPALFQGYIAASPAVVEGNDWFLGYEEAFANLGRPLKARLYLTGAQNESPQFLAGIERYRNRLTQRNYDGFVHQYRLIDGERHAGTKAESYVRGMRFVFAPLAPETGPMKD